MLIINLNCIKNWIATAIAWFLSINWLTDWIWLCSALPPARRSQANTMGLKASSLPSWMGLENTTPLELLLAIRSTKSTRSKLYSFMGSRRVHWFVVDLNHLLCWINQNTLTWKPVRDSHRLGAQASKSWQHVEITCQWQPVRSECAKRLGNCLNGICTSTILRIQARSQPVSRLNWNVILKI